MNIAVIGSRSFRDQGLMDRTLAEYRGRMTQLISGGAEGADSMAAAWARRHRIETLIFKPDFRHYRHAYHVRNRRIVDHAELLIAFWNGRSSGTRYTIDYARRTGCPVAIVRF